MGTLNAVKYKMENLGLVHVYTGNGKGKTSAGLGIILRALGYKSNVKIIQLFKEKNGEKYFFEKEGIKCLQFKSLHPYFGRYDESELKELKKEFIEFWNEAIKNLEIYDFVLIDEIGPAIKGGIISEELVIEFISSKPKNTELILTGRDIPESVRKLADYISEINEIKHPYNNKISARKGVEF